MNLQDDPAMLAILEEFKRVLPLRLRELREAIRFRDHERVRLLAHQLKGAGGSDGQHAVAAAAMRVEIAATERVAMPQLLEAYEPLADAVAGAISSATDRG